MEPWESHKQGMHLFVASNGMNDKGIATGSTCVSSPRNDSCKIEEELI